MSSREERIRDHGTTNDNKASRPPNKPPLNPTRTRAHSRTAFANLHAIIMGIGVAGNREDNVAEETTETPSRQFSELTPPDFVFSPQLHSSTVRLSEYH